MSFAVISLFTLALLVLLLGLAVIVRPRIFNDVAQYFLNPWGIRAAAAVRILAAILLWLAAPVSRLPQAFYGLAVLALVAGVAVLLIAPDRIRSLTEWAIARPAWVLRSFGSAAVTVGGFILWALTA